MNDVISKEQVFNNPIGQVWKAITTAEGMSIWLEPTNFKAIKGFQYVINAKANDCPPIVGEVLEADPYTRVYSWVIEANPVRTIVKWILEEVGGGTKIYLEHSGIAGYTGEDAIAMFNSFSGGWERCFDGITKLLQTEINAG